MQKYNLRINNPKTGYHVQTNQLIALWVSGNVNICVIISSWVGFPGLVIQFVAFFRDDHSDQKEGFEYLPPNLSISYLGALISQQIPKFWNFLNNPVHPGLNSEVLVGSIIC